MEPGWITPRRSAARFRSPTRKVYWISSNVAAAAGAPHLRAQRDQRVAARSYLEWLGHAADSTGESSSACPLLRRLREAGLSFSQLLDETRQQLVLHYLRALALELAEIAFRAGSPARAFRRWSG
ncbi:hypothetical protein FBY03_11772 [Pseudomonas sp. SJZ079]|nr:hypothetical protein FBY03_11772 [Pseudomonas sp. SJZ079]